MRLLLAATLVACAHGYSCGAPPPLAAGTSRRAAATITMGSFDDMLAKTKKRDEERESAPAAPTATAVPAGKGSLASQMLDTVADAGVNRLFPAAAKLFGVQVDEEEAAAPPAPPSAEEVASAANAEVADIDARAQKGELSFKDFLTMGEAFAGA